MDLKSLIRDVPDFPIKGIIFKDITTLLKNGKGLETALDSIYEGCKNYGITKVIGIESRGFILGGALAVKLGAGFVPIRKPGKLPSDKISKSYQLEYGTDTIEMHLDAIKESDKVLIHDDLLATGGTMQAACQLVEETGAEIVQISFIIELAFLKGRDMLEGYAINSLVTY